MFQSGHTIVPGARPRPPRRVVIVSGVVGGLAGMLAATIYAAHGADLWLSVALIPAGVFVGAMFWYCVPIKS